MPDAYIVPSTYRDAKSGAAATRQLLALPQRPTAILFPDDFSAIGGIQTIRQEGLLIPRDIDRKSTRLNSSHSGESRMPSSA